ncbi:MAG: cyanoexosortase A [Microcoleus sp. PH2017_10_PVI_O_A]|uniref:cyanoexosortase A n=1 Tax=unclassified Microcoleus TaxID=2642155 RepID=UPI001D77C001|nr:MULTISPECIES: cyanoexosortase A [unclassified Microcoleus]TAE83441.1 MAG: cyanoexosortase A [Oscillatoriales cyanobacterium]MCC3404534.1 cyanoexosortase A [Microcoleus sp. PH2017_10_PVI_O_A]MCC3458602.1 cyanoexosortase A [Microcoleus sp. PH2017_11_PCY_U_A]MCC3476852.1 cyanoexosortase A [Microcoleus sp. PH2017_12_PCY_D_A]MCC3526990.1 cyanoexosortase A [Microcoleus sp. PH2017_21_RUC_O_A]
MFNRKLFWLIVIATGLITLNMTLLWKMGDRAHFYMSLVFWLAVGSILWDKQNILKQSGGKRDLLSLVAGTILIAFILFKSAMVSNKLDPFLRVAPFLSGLGLGIIAVGFQDLKKYWRELVILFFHGVPSAITAPLSEFIASFTAKSAHVILWYLGFDVMREGNYVSLPTGRVLVYGGCSGLEAMNYLLGLSVVCLVMFPTKQNKALAIGFAIACGYIVNAFRVAAMALLVAHKRLDLFKYWHDGEGSLVVGMIGVILFGIFYQFMLKKDSKISKPSVN